MGSFIVLDGLDGSGKETQSRLLSDAITAAGHRVRLLSYPRYGTPGAAAVELYLRGGLGGRAEDTGAYAASSFFAIDRYISYRTEWSEDYRAPDTVIIANRYTTANAVHQLSKLPREEWDGFLDWLWDYEFVRLGLPRPDIVYYLEMHPELSRRLIDSRARETGAEKDIHETDSGYLARSYEAALYAARRLGWITIKCDDGDRVRSRTEIFADITAALPAGLV